MLAGLISVSTATAEDKPDAKKDAEAKSLSAPPAADSVTEGSIKVGGQSIAYRATAGT